MEVGANGVAWNKMMMWVLLNPEVIPPVAGIDMASCASCVFFVPTNKENAIGGTRSNFLMSEKIECLEFGLKLPPKERMADGKQSPP